MKTIGSRRKVYNGTALKTVGGLTKKDLMKNKHNRIVSKKKHMKMKGVEIKKQRMTQKRRRE